MDMHTHVPTVALSETVLNALTLHESTATQVMQAINEIEQSDPARAVEMLIGLTEFAPSNSRYWLRLLRLACGGHGAVSVPSINDKLCFIASTETETNLSVHEAVLQTLLRAGFDDEAAKHARALRTNAGLSAKYWLLALRAFEKLGTIEEQIQAAFELSRCEISNLSPLINAGALLMRSGMAREALDMLNRHAHLETDKNQIATLAVEAQLILLQEKGDDFDAHHLADLEALADAAPSDPRLVALQTDLLLQHGASQAALKALERLPIELRSPALRLRHANALADQGHLDSALEMFKELLEEDPTNAHLRRRVLGLCSRNGRLAEAVEIYAQGLEISRGRFEATFAKSLDAITTSDALDTIPPHRLSWFETAARTKGVVLPSDLATLANRNARVDDLILNWIQAYPDRIGDLDGLITLSDDVTQMVDATLSKGKGLFLTGAHVGLLYAGPLALKASGHTFSYVASQPDLGAARDTAALISTSTLSVSAVGRKIMSALDKNHAIAIAVDGAGVPGEEVRTLFDKPIHLSGFVPRMSWRRGTPTLFPRIYFEAGQVCIHLIALPLPADGETEEEFRTRWLDAYIDNLTRFLVEHPTAIRGTGGFWNAVG